MFFEFLFTDKMLEQLWEGGICILENLLLALHWQCLIGYLYMTNNSVVTALSWQLSCEFHVRNCNIPAVSLSYTCVINAVSGN